MIRDFGIVWTERGLLLNGLANTAILSLETWSAHQLPRVRSMPIRAALDMYSVL